MAYYTSILEGLQKDRYEAQKYAKIAADDARDAERSKRRYGDESKFVDYEKEEVKPVYPRNSKISDDMKKRAEKAIDKNKRYNIADKREWQSSMLSDDKTTTQAMVGAVGDAMHSHIKHQKRHPEAYKECGIFGTIEFV